MTLISPSLISPATSKLFSYFPFTNHHKTHAAADQQEQQKQQQQGGGKSPELPTYITIVMRKDGTPTTKCLNPPPLSNNTANTSRPTISNRRRRSSLSSSSSQNLASPPKQRRLMISSLIPRFNSRRNSSSSSSSNMGLSHNGRDDSHCSSNSMTSNIISNGLMTVMMTDQQASTIVSSTSSGAAGTITVTGDYNLSSKFHIFFVQENAKFTSIFPLAVKQKRHLLHLPSELTIQILLSLDRKTILQLSTTCKQFYRMCHKQHHYLWQTLFQSDYFYKQNKQQQPRKLSIPHHIPAYDLYKNHFELAKRWKYGQVNTKYLTGHEDSVYCLVWVGNNRIVSGSRDRSIKLWDLQQQENACLLTKVAHEGSVLCLRVSADNSFLVSGSSDTTCLIWSLSDLLPAKRLVGHSGGVLDVCIMGDYIVSSSRDATIRVWDRLTGQEKRQLVGHAGPVNALGSNPQCQDGRVVSASGDTTLKIWDIETGNCLRTFVGHTRGLACVRFDGQLIYSGGQDNKLKVWDVDTGKCVSTLAGHSDLIRTIDSFEVSKTIFFAEDLEAKLSIIYRTRLSVEVMIEPSVYGMPRKTNVY